MHFAFVYSVFIGISSSFTFPQTGGNSLARMAAASPRAFCGRLTDGFAAAAAATFSGDARDALLSQGHAILLPALETRISPFIGLKKQIGDHLFLIYTTGV